MLTGQKLIEDINAYSPPPGELAFWWLGQLGFVIKAGPAVMYIDAFLTRDGKRLIPPLLEAGDIRNADLIFGTHDHRDHIDRPVWPAMAAASPEARFVVSDLLRPKLSRELNIPIERFVGIDDGGTVELALPGGTVRITGVAAAHEFLEQDPATGKFPHMGYIIQAGGCTVYHSGDCCIYEGLQTKLKAWKLDLAILPINGRDASRFARGCLGNMTYQETADLAGAVSPGLIVPGHYEMFADNPGDVGAFVEYMRVKYPHLAVCVCRHGQRVVVKHRG